MLTSQFLGTGTKYSVPVNLAKRQAKALLTYLKRRDRRFIRRLLQNQRRQHKAIFSEDGRNG